MGTIVAVFVGAGSLLLTGVATYYQALVSRDQLEQSQEDADRKAREQAQRISSWVEDFGNRKRMHVMNRSPDPVYDVLVYAEATLEPFEVRTVRYVSGFPAIGPCTEVIDDERTFGYEVVNKVKMLPGPIIRLNVVFVRFTDRDGVPWLRYRSELIRQGAGDQLLDLGAIVHSSTDARTGRISKSPVVKQAAACGPGDSTKQ